MQEPYTEFENTPAEFKMIFVEGGVFEMGGESGYDDSLPVHKVQVSSFWMGEFVVTQAVWSYVMAGTAQENPSIFKGVNRPVENVSYDDIMYGFLPRLNIMTGQRYRLSTEVDWEYAAKGGKYGQKYLFIYAGSNKLEEVGWYYKNSHNETQALGLKTPNLLGFYDMSGNVQEWCSDWYAKDTSTANVLSIDLATSPDRVFRGGDWFFNARGCHSTNRYVSVPTFRSDRLGFRLVLSQPFNRENLLGKKGLILSQKTQ